MADRTYVYIDGESHFIRSEKVWQKLHGVEGLERLRYIGHADPRLVLVHSAAKVFWTRRMNPGATRMYYFTSLVGDETAHHELSVTLRSFDLEPYVVRERSQLAKQRQNALLHDHVIEKAKGVDIALAVRMLEDANHQYFDKCHLYTSDIDFLPVIEAVRAKGKHVYVHGYKDGLSQQSPFLHACDLFTDLGEMLRTECDLAPSE